MDRDNVQETTMPEGATSDPVSDVQGSQDDRRIPIDLVGVKGVRHPVKVADRSGSVQGTVAVFDMYVSLPHDQKGTHMSRFLQILNGHGSAISVETFEGIVSQVSERLESEDTHITMQFPFFVEKAAPVSEVKSMMDYEVTFEGGFKGAKPFHRTKVLVPVTSLCPCSKKISAYGAHNQRSHVTLTVESSERVWVEELIDVAEALSSSQLYGVLKRPDEKYVTEQAYDNPKFVEDLARDVALALSQDERITKFVVEVENFESIHNHSAYALIEGPNSSAG